AAGPRAPPRPGAPRPRRAPALRDVRPPRPECGHHGLTDVEAQYAEADAREFHRERQPHVAEPDDADERGAVLRLRDQDVRRALGRGRRHRLTGVPPAASERVAASSTRTT